MALKKPKSKVCSGKCGKRKSIEKFGRNPRMKDGHQAVCSKCLSDNMKKVRRKMVRDGIKPGRKAAKKAAVKPEPAPKRNGPTIRVAQVVVPPELRNRIAGAAWRAIDKRLKSFTTSEREVIEMYRLVTLGTNG